MRYIYLFFNTFYMAMLGFGFGAGIYNFIVAMRAERFDIVFVDSIVIVVCGVALIKEAWGYVSGKKM